MPPKKPKSSTSVRFSMYAPDRENVFLAGTFNEWKPDALPMSLDGDGRWTVSLDLSPGDYEYKFVTDGEWCCDPDGDAIPFECECVENPFGSRNLRVHVSPK